ncbi:MAG: type II secretion system F family protein [Verrucomicrobia bacterium]|nr:type II secretion system F family protein [Verrucomicrobiota bacterium]
MDPEKLVPHTIQITPQEIIAPLMWMVFAFAAAWYVGMTAGEVKYARLADGRQQMRKLPLLFRLLLPFVPNVSPLFQHKRLEKYRANLDGRLISAGYEGVLSAEEFMSIQLLMFIVAVPLSFGFQPALEGLPGVGRFWNVGTILMIGYSLIYPTSWLKQTRGIRHRSMQKALPYVLDLMTLSVEAGLDFMSAIRKIIERRAMDPLGEELLRVFHEIQVGKTRRQALRDMGLRVDQPDISSVVSALVQADELGVSLGTILRIMADQMRTKRFQRAEKLAYEAPVKMLGPLLLLIFPAVMLFLLGPILAQAFRSAF